MGRKMPARRKNPAVGEDDSWPASNAQQEGGSTVRWGTAGHRRTIRRSSRLRVFGSGNGASGGSRLAPNYDPLKARALRRDAGV